MICASIGAGSTESAVARMREAAAAGADLVELRLDLLRDPEPSLLMSAAPLPVVATCRPQWEGGRFSGTEAERVGLLEEMCQHGAAWVDIEYRGYKDFPRHGARRILSFHDFRETPADLERTAARMAAMEPEAIKIATMAGGTADVLRLLALQKRATLPSTVIAMGSWGEPLRVLAPRYGGLLIYGPAVSGEETAPGQIPVKELCSLYRSGLLDESTRIFGVTGNPVGHSRGPAIFNPVFRDLSLSATYVRFPLDDLSLFREMMDAFEVEGMSVTVPHKKGVISLLDEIDPSAARIGSVNTVHRREGRLWGGNTDRIGAMTALKEGARSRWPEGLRGRTVLVVGAGGAARSIVWGLRDGGAEVIIANRTVARGEELARETGARAVGLEAISELSCDGIVNVTTLGMTPHEDAMPPVETLLGPEKVVMDSVYTPRRTKLLRLAESRGATTVDGVRYFLRQAEAQLKIWTGREFPESRVEAFLEEGSGP